MAGSKPRQGWIYLTNPYRVLLRCKLGHIHFYNLDNSNSFYCKNADCRQTINYSRVFRGEQPYIIWKSDKFKNGVNYIDIFTAIPLTFDIRERDKGLPTIYPINPTNRNGFEKQSLALTHEVFTVDANCFKDVKGDWLTRIGQIDKPDKQAIEERLNYFLNIQQNPSDDWFVKNVLEDVLNQVFDNLSADNQESALEILIDDVEF